MTNVSLEVSDGTDTDAPDTETWLNLRSL